MCSVGMWRVGRTQQSREMPQVPGQCCGPPRQPIMASAEMDLRHDPTDLPFSSQAGVPVGHTRTGFGDAFKLKLFRLNKNRTQNHLRHPDSLS